MSTGLVGVDRMRAGPMLIGFDAVYRSDGWLKFPLFELRELFELDTGLRGRSVLRPFAGRATPDVAVRASLIPRLTDHHVHLGIANPAEVFRNGITHVTDLGWAPGIAQTWTELDTPKVAIAGALLSCVGGYPVNAGWAASGSTVEVGGASAADAAVDAQQQHGASVIKITLNSDAGPVPDDQLLDALVVAAHTRGLPVFVHAQGVGQTQRAFAAGVDVFAHAPFSELVPDGLLSAMAEHGTRWVSTLRIHGWQTPTRAFRVASDNIRRFNAVGGGILYGTDLGNGELRPGVNPHELAAIADTGADPMRAIAGVAGPGQPEPNPDGSIGPQIALVEGPPPTDSADLSRWLAHAHGRTVDSVVADAAAL